MPQVAHNERRLETRRVKANGDDRHGTNPSDLIYLKYKRKHSAVNPCGRFMHLLQAWIIKV